MIRKSKTVLLCALLSWTPLLAAQTGSAPDYDPWEGMNMRVHTFNEFMDDKLLRPTANAYVKVVPNPVRRSVSNFFSNLNDVTVLANNLLQFKFRDAASDSGRLLINTTLGIGGLFDVATGAGFEKHNEDFGQTLGAWGVPSGPYVVLPFFGPSNVRDSFGLAADTVSNPMNHQEDIALRNSAFAMKQLDRRAALLSVESLMTGDPYIFMREAYLQQREFLVTDGESSGSLEEDDEWDDWD